ncbi:hypothetical protein [Leeuwenhoekiella sp. LLG6367-2.1]|uniref:hypothetical protein n=1 Tax=Leeuwenhoekiella sp. LLG6367-2.1 TaxID=3160833 RepID=UPI00386807BE
MLRSTNLQITKSRFKLALDYATNFCYTRKCEYENQPYADPFYNLEYKLDTLAMVMIIEGF